VGEAQPGVRRLCVAAVTWSTGLLAAACQLADADRPCLSLDAPDDTEMAFAPPGIHEVAVVTQLTAAMEALLSTQRGAPGPAMLAFHVGITRIEGDGFGGAAPSRARSLLRHPDVRAAAAGCGRLAVIMSDGLYSDLQGEGLAAREWRPVPGAGAWVRCRAPSRSSFQ
jgi:hypothetical protein